jgi:hypothetical protein
VWIVLECCRKRMLKTNELSAENPVRPLSESRYETLDSGTPVRCPNRSTQAHLIDIQCETTVSIRENLCRRCNEEKLSHGCVLILARDVIHPSLAKQEE